MSAFETPPPEPLMALCRRWKIRTLSLFGSAARGEARPDSDIDLLIEYDPGADWSLLDTARLHAELTELFGRPTHPYTHGLLACVPVPGKIARGEPLGSIPGTVPKIGPGYSGCAFRERCAQAMPACGAGDVPGREAGPEHRYECHLGADWTARLAAEAAA